MPRCTLYTLDRFSLRLINCVEPITAMQTFYAIRSLAPNIIYYWATDLKGVMVQNATTCTTTGRPYQLGTREIDAGILLGVKPPKPLPRHYASGPDRVFPRNAAPTMRSTVWQIMMECSSGSLIQILCKIFQMQGLFVT